MFSNSTLPVGIYEKAFPTNLSWEERLDLAAKAGYDFVEMSIDESEARLARLSWPGSERAALRRAISNVGIPIYTMCLSGHRKYPLGSASAEAREKALDILVRTIELASDVGAKIIQIMGYDVFYERSDDGTQARFLEGLRTGARWAGTAGVMLALENVDIEFVDSVEKTMRIMLAVNSPWFNLYPDMGNLVAAGHDPVSQLRLAKGHIVGVHVKDAIPGEIRGVPFEQGKVPFNDVFQVLAEIGFWGPLAVEMWAHLDTTGDPLKSAITARKLVDRLVSATWVAHKKDKEL